MHFVTNITDVEDKIIAAAEERGITTQEVATEATAQFLDAYRRLGVHEPDALLYATEHIDEMLETIGRLVERGHAYPAGGSVWFAVRSLPGYGKLSGRNPDELRSGARIEPGRGQAGSARFRPLEGRQAGRARPGSPRGDRAGPGWHIECSAMAEEELGSGSTSTAVGSTWCSRTTRTRSPNRRPPRATEPFARYWLHNGMVRLKGEKMAKSTGMVVGLLDLLDQYPPEAVRLFYLRAHYRQPIDFGDEAMADAAAAVDRLWAFRRRAGATDARPRCRRRSSGSPEAMDDDFNTAEGAWRSCSMWSAKGTAISMPARMPLRSWRRSTRSSACSASPESGRRS